MAEKKQNIPPPPEGFEVEKDLPVPPAGFDIVRESTDVLPGRESVEQLQINRTPALQILQEELTTKPEGFMNRALRNPVIALKTLGLIQERIEGAVATPLQRIQDPEQLQQAGFTSGGILSGVPFSGADKPKMTSREFTERTKLAAEESGKKFPDRVQFLGKLVDDIVEGAKGEKLTQFGDIPRRAGFPEPISAAIGLGTSVAIIDPLVNKAVTKTFSRAGKGLKNLFTGDRERVLGAVDDFVGGLDDYIRVAGENVEKVWTGAIGRQRVNLLKLKEAIDTLPENVINKMKSKDIRKIFKIKFDDNGLLVTTKENIWRVRRYVDDFITPKQFAEGTSSAIKGSIQKGRNLLKEILNEGESKIVTDIMDNYSNFVGDWEFMRSTLTTKGRPIANKVIKLFTRGGEPAKKKAMERMVDFVPTGKKVINKAIDYNRSENALKLIVGGVLVGGATLGAKKITAQPIETIVDSGGGGGQ